ncbi:MAG: hypothetical protein H6Q86_1343, partial [candidate division NC10 bacterium]|nr:hypothetical protein [candidate division NC10 bacterium]
MRRVEETIIGAHRRERSRGFWPCLGRFSSLGSKPGEMRGQPCMPRMRTVDAKASRRPLAQDSNPRGADGARGADPGGEAGGFAPP